MIATICMENTRSKSLFERNGYEQCALFKEIGYKFDRKLDIGSFKRYCKEIIKWLTTYILYLAPWSREIYNFQAAGADFK